MSVKFLKAVAEMHHIDRFDNFRSHGVISWADERLLVSQKACAAWSFLCWGVWELAT
jgi:hypothetical protein